MTDTRQTYSFGPLERRGLFGGVRAGQVAALTAGALTAIVVLDHAPSAGGAFMAMVACALAAATAFAPLGGRTLQEWAPVAVAFAARRLRRRHRFHSPVAEAGSAVGGDGEMHSAPAVAPRALRDVRIISVEHRERAIGALSERSGRRLTAVLACRVAAFSLLDQEAQERRLARWGLVLSGAGGTAIRRLQWIERTAPAQGDELARWVHSERDPRFRFEARR